MTGGLKLAYASISVDVVSAEVSRDIDWSHSNQQSDTYLLNTKIRTVTDSLEVLVEVEDEISVLVVDAVLEVDAVPSVSAMPSGGTKRSEDTKP